MGFLATNTQALQARINALQAYTTILMTLNNAQKGK
jgi:hypothetical protein